MIAKSVSIKDAGGKSGGRVSKAVELIAGEQVTAPPIPIFERPCRKISVRKTFLNEKVFQSFSFVMHRYPN
jgi:hypothetical protein